jgi:hypothetical protein
MPIESLLIVLRKIFYASSIIQSVRLVDEASFQTAKTQTEYLQIGRIQSVEMEEIQ